MLREGKETAPGQGPTRRIPWAAQRRNAIRAQGIRHPTHRRFGHYHRRMRGNIGQITKCHALSRHAKMPRGTVQAILKRAGHKALY
jgi:hypothetical protein